MLVSKLKFIFITVIVQFAFLSCHNHENDVIPDITVEFYISYSDPEFFDLFYSPGTSAFVSASQTYLGIGTGGFDNNGIIMYNTGMEGFEYAAFDRTCPNCYVNASASVAVNVDGVFAVCPKCSTNYALGGSGLPQSGPGLYYLKNYQTVFSGGSIRVWNKK
jgi:hypothetical protein